MPLPLVAGIGGMVTSVCIYLAVNAGRSSAHGWGIVMATDIAFVLGALALLGDRVPAGVRVFLLTLAIVDDVGAIVEWISAVMTLLPGDLILTGTPAGVGPIEDGDTVSITVAGIGTLSNPVVQKQDS